MKIKGLIFHFLGALDFDPPVIFRNYCKNIILALTTSSPSESSQVMAKEARSSMKCNQNQNISKATFRHPFFT